MKSLKAEPHKYLTDAEKYLINFWTPQAGDTVIYRGKKFTLDEILESQATVKESKKKVFWLQDLAWKPTLENCDTIASKFNSQIMNNQIFFRKLNQRCFFERPSNIDEYRDIIRQLRVLSCFQQPH
jgi:hypothetical protein